MMGVYVELLSRTYDELELINEWFNLYPYCEHVLLQNSSKLDSMFEVFKDMTPITKEEKEYAKNVKIIYKKMMNH